MRYLRNKLFLYLFAWITIGLSSCGGKSEKAVSSTIPLLEVQGETTLDELLEIVDCTPLELSEKSLMGNIHKMNIYQKKYYILDRVQTRKVHVFHFDGSYSHSIGSTGGGPGEYSSIQDFTIDEENERIAILSLPATVYMYDLSGNFLFSKKIGEILFNNICSTPEGFVCSTNHNTLIKEEDAFLLFFFDKNVDLKEKRIPSQSAKVSFPPFVTNPLISTPKGLVFFDHFTSTFYHCPHNSPQEMQPFHFELDAPIPPEAYADPMLFFNSQQNSSFFLESYVVDNTLWAFLVKRGRLTFLLFNMDTGEIVFKDHKDFNLEILDYEEGYLYSSLDPSFLLEHDNKWHYPLNESARYPIEEEGNRVIVRYRIK